MGHATGILVNDFDDERTLDEEEAMEGSEDSHNELSHLQKEGDMPLKDLLVMYGYGDPAQQDPNKSGEADDDEDEEEEEDEDEDEEEDDGDPANYESDLKQFYTEMVNGDKNGNRSDRSIDVSIDNKNSNNANLAVNQSSEIGDSTADAAKNRVNAKALVGGSDDLKIEGNSEVENSANVGEVENSGGGGGGGSSRLLRSVSRPQSEEEEDDCDYSPDEEEWKKTIMVGSDYQAAIPEGLCKYDDALPYENEDKILWDPSHVPELTTQEFLEKAQVTMVKGTSLPTGAHIKDDEQALYLLLQCGYNLEEALRRRRINVLPSSESISLWSEEECHNFESGLRTYGKDFHLIQKNKVKTRSVGELVQFYYLWKKTERHDIFTYKARLEKKKYALHPGITDYMDRFLEEQEGLRDRSSSPNVHCLLYGDVKRQKPNTSLSNNDDPKCGDSWEVGTAPPGSTFSNNVIMDPIAGDYNASSMASTTQQFTPSTTSQAHQDHAAPNTSNTENTSVSRSSIISFSTLSPNQQLNHTSSSLARNQVARSPENVPLHLPP